MYIRVLTQIMRTIVDFVSWEMGLKPRLCTNPHVQCIYPFQLYTKFQCIHISIFNVKTKFQCIYPLIYLWVETWITLRSAGGPPTTQRRRS